MELRIALEETISAEEIGGSRYENLKPRLEVVIDTDKDFEEQMSVAREKFKVVVLDMVAQFTELRKTLKSDFDAKEQAKIEDQQKAKALMDAAKHAKEPKNPVEDPKPEPVKVEEGAKPDEKKEEPKPTPPTPETPKSDGIKPSQKSALRGMLKFKPMDESKDAEVFEKLGIKSWDDLDSISAGKRIMEIQAAARK